MNLEKNLQNFFESIDFLPQGEKIAELKKAISIANKSDFDWESDGESEFDFLRLLKPKEIRRVIEEVEKQKNSEIKKFEEMRAVFKEFHSKISDKQIMEISHPAGLDVRITETKGDHFAITDKLTEGGMNYFFFTSTGMNRWFRENPERQPFKVPHKQLEDRINDFKAFGIAYSQVKNDEFLSIHTIQPVAFYTASRKGKRSEERR